MSCQSNLLQDPDPVEPRPLRDEGVNGSIGVHASLCDIVHGVVAALGGVSKENQDLACLLINLPHQRHLGRLLYKFFLVDTYRINPYEAAMRC